MGTAGRLVPFRQKDESCQGFLENRKMDEAMDFEARTAASLYICITKDEVMQ